MTDLPPGRSPYLLQPPACISFSGGRTSAFMLRQILDAHGGVLPDGVHVLFANTGKERLETLDFVEECSQRWGVRVRWIEWQRGTGKREQKKLAEEWRAGGGKPEELAPPVPWWREVSHATASRNGEPFDALCSWRGYLPNSVTRMCTADLKIRTMGRWMDEQGYEHWDVIIGLRYDEPARVAKIHAPNRERYERYERHAPLYHARVIKAHVLAWWAEQPFDLRLKNHEGNCDLCFLKALHKRVAIIRDKPALADWWIEQEKKHGQSFKSPKREPGGYAQTVALTRKLPLLPGLDDLDDDDSIDCACTD